MGEAVMRRCASCAATRFKQGARLGGRRRLSSKAGASASLGTGVVLAVPIVATLSLGVWQVQRLQWKRDLLAARDSKLRAPPFDMDDAPVIEDELDAQEFEYMKVRLNGVLDTSKVAYLGPRSPQAHVPAAMKMGKTVTGYHVIQPFTLKSGRRVLVNRGWILRDDRDKDVLLMPDETHFVGIVKGPEAPSNSMSLIGDIVRSDGNRDHLWRDVVGIAGNFGTEPICIDAIDDMDDSGSASGDSGGSARFSRHWKAHEDTLVPFKADMEHYLAVRTPPQQHMAYAATWFTLSALMSAMAFRQFRPRIIR